MNCTDDSLTPAAAEDVAPEAMAEVAALEALAEVAALEALAEVAALEGPAAAAEDVETALEVEPAAGAVVFEAELQDADATASAAPARIAAPLWRPFMTDLSWSVQDTDGLIGLI